MSGRSEMMKLKKELEHQGFVVIRTGSGHWKVTHPERAESVIMGFSPSGVAFHKTLKRLKAMGYRP